MQLRPIVDRILSLSASIVAIAALATAVYEARINRAHQRVIVWPYVTQFNSDSGGAYQRKVQNAGIGPALIRSFQVRVDGHVMRSWDEVLAQIAPAPAGRDSGFAYSTLATGSVLTPGSSVTLLLLTDPARARRFHGAVDRRLETRVCYCSLYGDCWQASSQATEPAAVKACRAEPEIEFTQ
jgi:hypothetical protein